MVKEILLKGEQSAIPGRDLCMLLNMRPRDLQKLIERERRDGAPICASYDRRNPGYYLAETQEEMRDYCGKLRKRAGEIFKTRRACLKSAETLPERAEVWRESK